MSRFDAPTGDLDGYLTRTDLLDCQGRVEHALTLLADGRVRVRRGAATIVIDPASGEVEPPGAVVPDHVLHAVGDLAGRPVPSTGRIGHHGHHGHGHH